MPYGRSVLEMAFEWELTQEIIYLPLGCLQGVLQARVELARGEGGEQPPRAGYRGTSLVRKRQPLGPYRRHVRRALWRS